MQCEGITRSGQRCRRKALEGELFCSIHQRVNQTYSLALLVPFLTVLLLAYFFLYGIFFDTLVYGVFDLNYLKFAGLSDLFVSMLRVGGLLTVVVLKLWLVFTILTALVLAIALVIKLTIVTSRLHLKFGRRLRIIGLSLGIYVLNFLCLFIFLFPRLNQKEPLQLLVGREHLARTLRAEKKRHHPALPRKFRKTTHTYFRHFLTLSSIRNHRFFATLLVLAITSLVSIIYAGHQARNVRACVTEAAQNPASIDVPASNLPGITITTLCLDGTDPEESDISVAGKFSKSLSSFFSFPAIVLTSNNETIPLVYVGSTDRFELFFSGVTHLPFILPNQNLGLMFNGGRPHSADRITDLQAELAELAAQAQKTGQAIGDLTPGDQSGRVLKRLDQKLALLESDLQHVFDHRQQLSLSSVPSLCWERPPLAILKFDPGKTDISGRAARQLIEDYAMSFLVTDRQRIVLSGYADPTGSAYQNDLISENRATAARALFLAAGLDPAHVTAIGHGEDHGSGLPRRRVEIRDCTGL